MGISVWNIIKKKNKKLLFKRDTLTKQIRYEFAYAEDVPWLHGQYFNIAF